MFFRSLLLAAVSASTSLALNNGVASTPPMGWNPYNAFLCSATEADYKAAAQSLISLGLNTVGYNYVNLDCGWQGKARNSAGRFTWDNTTVPSGIPALSTFIHGLGLKFGVYSDAGYYACDFVGGTAHYIGSLNYETSDANSFAEWGADYLKYDNCYAVSPTDFVNFNPSIFLEPHYAAMRDALTATHRPIVFSICNWGVQDPARWPASAVGNSWRIANDIGPPPSWDNLFRIINQLAPIAGFAEVGGWNDLDLLEVGHPELTIAEQQTHFAFWAAVKSPLFISMDLSKASSETLNILKNERIIALNQDPLGKSIVFTRRYTNDHDVWAGPLADGSTVAVIINWQNVSRSLTFNLADVGFSSATALNLITGHPIGKLRESYISTVGAHGCLVLKLTKGVRATPPSFTFYYAAASSNTLTGTAAQRVVNSTVTVVGNIGNGSTLTINGVDGGKKGGTKTVSLDYINGDVAFYNTACSNCRNVFISVNGGSAVQVQMPISGQSWDILSSGYLVSLPGFKPGKINTIQFSNPTGYAPDFYRAGVSV